MKNKKIKRIFNIAFGCVLIAMFFVAYFKAKNSFQNTGWALFPPFVAIVTALITKEVYGSLFLGIVTGAILSNNFNLLRSFEAVFKDGILFNICDEGKAALLIWPVFLGVIVVILNKTGVSQSFGVWAGKKIKTRVGAQLCAVILGCFIFIDDYFNCLTVGNVMRPITDKNRVSRAKLAYIIDSTAAPICIIAPISSWAAAVNGFIPGEDGFVTFIKTIPYNFYALFTIIFVIMIAVLNCDFGPMAVHEKNAENGDLFTTENLSYSECSNETYSDENAKCNIFDLFAPIVLTVIFCLCGMLYTGNFFGGVGFGEALANCNASLGLLYGSFSGMAFTMIYFIIRKLLSFRECMNCVPEGLRLMTPGIIILILAWSLNSFTANLGASEFVSQITLNSEVIISLLPAFVFLISAGLSFATGTSWGTFSLLIPITIAIMNSQPDMIIIGMSACLAGSVCGDHCSPISDTTVMSSSGAQCEHINHVITQLPYVLTVAAVSFVSSLIAGITKNLILSLTVGVLIISGIGVMLHFIRMKSKITLD